MTAKVNSQAFIEVTDLVTHYGTRQVLCGVNLTVFKGEVMVIMGGSGSGKSTLLRYLLGLNRPSSGCIKLMGKDITQMNEHEMHQLRQEMGVAFQGGALFSSMTVGENIILPLREHTRLDEKTTQIMCRLKLELVNLAGFEGLMPSELSGGMVKRAALARAVIMDPKLLFFDEPSAGLDPVVAAELDELIIQLRDSMNITVVIVTHDLESTYKIADRITVLDQGRIIMTGTVDAVRHSKNKRIRDLLNRQPSHEQVNADEYLRRLAEGNE